MSRPLVHILYFAWLRERVGRSQEDIELPPEVRDIAGLVDWLRSRGDSYQRAFAIPGIVRCAVNQDFAGPEHALHDGDEVAFFPPVTGG